MTAGSEIRHAQSAAGGKYLAATRRWLRRNPIWLFALLLGVYFAFKTPFFFTPYNVSNILTQATLVGFIAIGMTPVIISGNIDLTVGSTAALTACLVVVLAPFGPLVAVPAALLAGLLVGLANSLFTERLGINSFIVTLALMSGIRGLAFLLVGDVSLSLNDFRYNDAVSLAVGPISLITAVFLVVAVLLALALALTPWGRNIYAVGSRREAAEDTGVNAARVVTIGFVVSGLLAAVCGIAMAAKLSAAAPSFATGYELSAIAVIILGGTRLSGGHGYISGTVGATLALAILQNGLNLIGASPFIIPIIIGVVLILALLLDLKFLQKVSAN